MKKGSIKLSCLFIVLLSLFGFTTCNGDITIGLGNAIDTQPPEVSIKNPLPKYYVRGDFTMSGTYYDDYGLKDIKVVLENKETKAQFEADNVAVLNKDGTWDCLITTLYADGKHKIPDGDYTATATATDQYGHSTEATQVFSIDNTPPVVILTTPKTTAISNPTKCGQVFSIRASTGDDSQVDSVDVIVYDENHVELGRKNIHITGKDIENEVAVWDSSIDEDEFYELIYGTEKANITKNYYCKLIVYDSARKLPAEADDKGNGAEYFYLAGDANTNSKKTFFANTAYTVLATEGSVFTDDVLKTYDINRNADSCIQNEIYNDYVNWYVNRDQLRTEYATFSLNPVNNPTYKLTNYSSFVVNPAYETLDEIDANSDEIYGFRDRDKLTVTIAQGLDGDPLIVDTIGLRLIESDATGTALRNKNGNYENEIYLLYPYTNASGNPTDFVNKFENQNAHDEQITVGTDTYSMSFTLNSELIEGLETGHYFIVDVIGFDTKGVEVHNQDTFAIKFIPANSTPPTITVTSPEKSAVTIASNAAVDFAGFVVYNPDILQIDAYIDSTDTAPFASTESASNKITLSTPEKNGQKYGVSYSFTLPTSVIEQIGKEEFNVIIQATLTRAGLSSQSSVMITNDTLPPEFGDYEVSPYIDETELVNNLPVTTRYVNGNVKATINISDDITVKPSVTYSLDNGETWSEVQKTNKLIISSISTTDIAEKGKKTILLKAQDDAGNQSENTIELNVKQSTDEPVVNLSNADGTLTTEAHIAAIQKNIFGTSTNNQINGTITDDDGIKSVKVRYKKVGAPDDSAIEEPQTLNFKEGDKSYNLKYTIPADMIGTYQMTILVEDTNAETSYSSKVYGPFAIAVDNGTPQLTATTSSGAYQAANASFTISGTVTDEADKIIIGCYEDAAYTTRIAGTSDITITNTQNGIWSFAIPTTDLGGNVYIKATDAYGQSIKKEFTYLIDAYAPTFAITQLNQGETYSSASGDVMRYASRNSVYTVKGSVTDLTGDAIKDASASGIEDYIYYIVSESQPQIENGAYIITDNWEKAVVTTSVSGEKTWVANIDLSPKNADNSDVFQEGSTYKVYFAAKDKAQNISKVSENATSKVLSLYLDSYAPRLAKVEHETKNAITNIKVYTKDVESGIASIKLIMNRNTSEIAAQKQAEPVTIDGETYDVYVFNQVQTIFVDDSVNEYTVSITDKAGNTTNSASYSINNTKPTISVTNPLTNNARAGEYYFTKEAFTVPFAASSTGNGLSFVTLVINDEESQKDSLTDDPTSYTGEYTISVPTESGKFDAEFIATNIYASTAKSLVKYIFDLDSPEFGMVSADSSSIVNKTIGGTAVVEGFNQNNINYINGNNTLSLNGVLVDGGSDVDLQSGISSVKYKIFKGHYVGTAEKSAYELAEDAVLADESVLEKDWTLTTGSTNWNLKNDFTADGDYSLFLRAEDNVGNVSYSKPILLISDKTAPVLSELKSKIGDASKEPLASVINLNCTKPITISGKIAEALSGVSKIELNEDDGTLITTATISGDEWTGTISAEKLVAFRGEEDSTVTIKITASDKVGNISSYSTFLKLDMTAPELSITGVSPTVEVGGVTKVNGTITVNGVANDETGIAEIRWFYDYDETNTDYTTVENQKIECSGTYKNYNITIDTTKFTTAAQTTAKDVELTVVAIDTVGNITVKEETLHVDQTTDAPMITFSNADETIDDIKNVKQGVNLFSPSNNNRVLGTITDDDGIETVKISYKMLRARSWNDPTTIEVGGKTSYSLNYTLPATEGPYELLVEVADSKNDSTGYSTKETSFAFAVDSGAPVFAVSTTSGAYRAANANLTINGSWSDGTSIVVARYNDSTCTGTPEAVSGAEGSSIVINNDGTWSDTFLVGEEDGAKYYKATDQYEQSTDVSFTYKVDATPPTFSVLSKGGSESEGKTYAKKSEFFAINGTAEDPRPANGTESGLEEFIYYTISRTEPAKVNGAYTNLDNWTKANIVKSDSGSTWSFTVNLSTGYTEGTEYGLYLAAKDVAGNVSKIEENEYSNKIIIVPDGTAPVITEVSGAPIQIIASTGGNLVFQATVNDEVSGIEKVYLYENNQDTEYEATLDGNKYTFAVPTSASRLTTGHHTFEIKAQDKVGNIGTSSSIEIDVDKQIPTVSINNVTPIVKENAKTFEGHSVTAATVNGILTLNLIASDETALSSIELSYINKNGETIRRPSEGLNGTYKAYSFELDSRELKEKEVTAITVVSKDRGGNISEPDVYYLYTDQDTDKPVINLAAPLNETKNAQSQISSKPENNLFKTSGAISGTITDDDGIKEITVFVGDSETPVLTDDRNTTPTSCTFEYTLSSLGITEVGEYKIRIAVKDIYSDTITSGSSTTQEIWIGADDEAPSLLLENTRDEYLKNGKYYAKGESFTISATVKDDYKLDSLEYTSTGSEPEAISIVKDSTQQTKTVVVTPAESKAVVYNFKVKDKFGKSTEQSMSFVYDLDAPTIALANTNPVTTNNSVKLTPVEDVYYYDLSKKIKIAGTAADAGSVTTKDFQSGVASVEYAVAKGHVSEKPADGESIIVDWTNANGTNASWNLELDGEVISAEGNYTVFVRTTDFAGNTTALSSPVKIAADSGKPAIAIKEVNTNTQTALNQYYNLETVNAADNKLVIKGTISEKFLKAYTVNVTKDGSSIATAFDSSLKLYGDDGYSTEQEWTITLDASSDHSDDGLYEITLTATDYSTNEGTLIASTRIDTTAPLLDSSNTTIGNQDLSQVNNYWFTNALINFAGQYLEAGSGIKQLDYYIKKPGENFSAARSGSFTVTDFGNYESFSTTLSSFVSSVGKDSHNGIMLRAIDYAGNITDNTFVIKLDESAPVLSDTKYKLGTGTETALGSIINTKATESVFLSGKYEETVSGLKSIKITGRGFTGDDAIIATVDENNNWAAEITKTKLDALRNGTDGSYAVKITTEDNAGNKNDSAVSFNIYIDKTAPDLSITGVSPTVEVGGVTKVNGTITVNGVANDETGIAEIRWFYNHTGTDYTAVSGQKIECSGTYKNYSITIDTTDFTKAEQTAKDVELTVVAIDTVGNITVKEETLHVDQTTDAPMITFSNADESIDDIKNVTQGVNLFSPSNNNRVLGTITDDDGIETVTVSYKKLSDSDLDSDLDSDSNWTTRTLISDYGKTSYSLNYTLPAEEGKYELKVVVADSKQDSTGYNAKSTVFKLAVDAGAPVFNLTTASGAYRAAKASLTINGSWSDGAAVVVGRYADSTCTGNAETLSTATESSIVLANDGKWTDTITIGITDATKYYKAVDEYGQSTIISFQYLVDALPPTFTVTNIGGTTVGETTYTKKGEYFTVKGTVKDTTPERGVASGIEDFIYYTVATAEPAKTTDETVYTNLDSWTKANIVKGDSGNTWTINVDMSSDEYAEKTSYGLYIAARDVAGNVSLISANSGSNSIKVQPDGTGPEISSAAADITQIVAATTGSVTLSATVSDSISGIKAVRLYKNNVDTNIALDESSSGTTYVFKLPVSDFATGHHTYVIRATDNVGNATDSSTIEIDVDKQAPTLALNSAIPSVTVGEATKYNGKVTISGIATDETGLKEIRWFVTKPADGLATYYKTFANATYAPIENQVVAVAETEKTYKNFSFTIDTTQLDDQKTSTVTVVAVDKAGNISGTKTWSLAVDESTDKPKITLDAPFVNSADAPIVSGTNLFKTTDSISLSMSDDDGLATINIYKDGSTTPVKTESLGGVTSATKTYKIKDDLGISSVGEYTLRVEIVDSNPDGYDNAASTTTQTIKIGVDDAKPSISLATDLDSKKYINNKYYTNSNFKITAKVDDDYLLSTLTATNGTAGSSLSTATTEEQSIEYSIIKTETSSSVTNTFVVTDKFANTNQESVTYVFDLDVPTIALATNPVKTNTTALNVESGVYYYDLNKNIIISGTAKDEGVEDGSTKDFQSDISAVKYLIAKGHVASVPTSAEEIFKDWTEASGTKDWNVKLDSEIISAENEGEYTVFVKVEDKAGNEASISPIKIVADKASPVIEVTTTVPEYYNNTMASAGVVISGKITESYLKEIKVTATKDGAVINNFAFTKTPVTGTTKQTSPQAWSVTIPKAGGKYVVTVTAKDYCGNSASPVSFTTTVDIDAPTFTLTSPIVVSDAVTVYGKKSAPYTVKGTVADTGLSKVAGLYYKLATSAPAISNGVYTENVTNENGWTQITSAAGSWTNYIDLSGESFVEGTNYVLYLAAVDNAGNKSVVANNPTAKLNIMLDSNGPTFNAFTKSVDNATPKIELVTKVIDEGSGLESVTLYNNDSPVTIDGTKITRAASTETIGGKSYSVYTYTFDSDENGYISAIPDGTNEYKVVAIDKAGNSTTYTTTQTIKNATPTLTVAFPDAFSSNYSATVSGKKYTYATGTFNISGTATVTEAETLKSVVWSDGTTSNGSVGTITENTEKTEGSFVFAATAVSTNENERITNRITATNIFGKSTSEQLLYIFDTTKPVIVEENTTIGGQSIENLAAHWFNTTAIAVKGEYTEAGSGIEKLEYWIKVPGGTYTTDSTGTIVPSDKGTYEAFNSTITDFVTSTATANNTIKLVATDKAGNVSDAKEYTVKVDLGKPELSAMKYKLGDDEESAISGTLYMNAEQALTLSGSFDDALSGVDSVKVQFTEAKTVVATLDKTTKKWTVSLTKDELKALAGGDSPEDVSLSPVVTATDKAGNSKDYTISMKIDVTNPTLPVPSYSPTVTEKVDDVSTVYVNGIISISGTASDTTGIKEITLYKVVDDSDDVLLKQNTYTDSAFVSYGFNQDTRDLTDNAETKLKIVVTDKVGNTNNAVVTLNVKQSTDTPTIALTSPLFNSNENPVAVNNNLFKTTDSIEFTVKDDDGVGSIKVLVNDGEVQTFENINSTSVTKALSLSELGITKAGEYTVQVYAEDTNPDNRSTLVAEQKTETLKINIGVDDKNPTVKLSTSVSTSKLKENVYYTNEAFTITAKVDDDYLLSNLTATDGTTDSSLDTTSTDEQTIIYTIAKPEASVKTTNTFVVKDKFNKSEQADITYVFDLDKPTIALATENAVKTNEKALSAVSGVYYYDLNKNIIINGTAAETGSTAIQSGLSSVMYGIAKGHVTTWPASNENIVQDYTSALGTADNWNLKIDGQTISEEGEYSIFVKVADLAGNTTVLASPVHIAADKLSPVIAITKVNDEAASTLNNFYNRNVVIEGTLAETYLKAVTLKVNGTETDFTTAPVTGTKKTAAQTWKYTLSSATEGEYTIEVIAEDQVGNKVSEVYKTTIDRTRPRLDTANTKIGNVKVVAAEGEDSVDNHWFTAEAFEISGQYVEELSGISSLSYWIQKPGESYSTEATGVIVPSDTGTIETFKTTISGFAESSGSSHNKIKFVAVDKAGNESDTNEYTIKIDEQKPELTELKYDVGENGSVLANETLGSLILTNKTNAITLKGNYNDNASGVTKITVSCSAFDGDDAITQYIDASSDALNGTWEATIGDAAFEKLVGTSYSVTITAYDSAGNKNDTKGFELQVDTSAPRTDISSPAKDSTLNGYVTLSGSVEEENTPVSLSLYYFFAENKDVTPTVHASISTADGWKLLKEITTNPGTDDETHDYGANVSDIYGWKISNYYTNGVLESAGVTNGHFFLLPVAVDKAGNSSVDVADIKATDYTSYLIDLDSDRPIIKLSSLTGKTGTLLKYDATVSGSIEDDDGVIKELKISPTPITTEAEWASVAKVTLSSGTFSYSPSDTSDGVKKMYFYIKDAKDGVFITNNETEGRADELYMPKISYKTSDGYSTAVTNNEKVSYTFDSNPPSYTDSYIDYKGIDAEDALSADKATTKIKELTDKVGGKTKQNILIKIAVYDANGIDSVTAKIDGVKEDAGDGTATDVLTMEASGTTTVDGNEYTNYILKINLADVDGIEATKTPAASGGKSVVFTITDKSGISTTTPPVSFTVDNDGPVIGIISPAKSGDVAYTTEDLADANDAEIGVVNIIGTTSDSSEIAEFKYLVLDDKNFDTGATKVKLADNNTDKLTTSWTLNVNGLPGDPTALKDYKTKIVHNTTTDIYAIPVYFYAKDELGNESTLSTYELKYNPYGDRPTVEVTSPGANANLNGTVQIIGSATDNVSIDSVYVQIDVNKDGLFDSADISLLKAMLDPTDGTTSIYTIYNESSTFSKPTPDFTASVKTVAGVESHDDFWGIKANGKASWNLSVNKFKELQCESASQGDGTNKFTLNYRVVAMDNNCKLGNWSEVRSFVIDTNIPQVPTTGTIVGYSDAERTEQTSEKAYAADMFLKTTENYNELQIEISDKSGIQKVEYYTAADIEGLNSATTPAAATIRATDDATSFTSGTNTYYSRVTAKIPLNKLGTTDTLAIKVVAYKNSETETTAYCNYNVNFDDTAPVMDYVSFNGDRVVDVATDENATGQVVNSNGVFTLGGKVTDYGSGFARTLFYYNRPEHGVNPNRVYDPLVAPTTDAAKITYNGIIFVKDAGTMKFGGQTMYGYEGTVTVAADLKTLTLTGNTKEKNIFAGGVVYINGAWLDVASVAKNASGFVTTVVLSEDTLATGAGNVDAFFPYVRVINNTGTEKNGFDSTSTSSAYDDVTDDGDGMPESVIKSQSTWTYDASVRSNFIPDGPGAMVVFVFDKAGNCSAARYDGSVQNNAPRITKLWLGTDLNGDSKYEASEFTSYDILEKAGGEQHSYIMNTADFGGKRFRVLNGLSVVSEFVGGNNANNQGIKLAYNNDASSESVKCVKKADNDSKWYDKKITIGGTTGITAAESFFTASDYSGSGTTGKYGYIIPKDDIGADSTGVITDLTKRSMSFTFWDDTEDSEQGINSGFCYLKINDFAVIQNDNFAPSVTIDPFFWNSADDSSIYQNNYLNGHIDLPAYITGSARKTGAEDDGLYYNGDALVDPKVSGKISIRGKAVDEHTLGKIWASFDGFTPTEAAFGENAKTVDGKTYYCVAYKDDDGAWQTASGSVAGNVWNFSILSDTADQNGNVIAWQLDIDTSGIEGAMGNDKVVRIIAEDQAKPVHSSSIEMTAGAMLEKDLEGNWLNSYDVNKYNVPYYQMDVVPYISGVEGANRSRLGRYPVRAGQTIKITGFNFATSPSVFRKTSAGASSPIPITVTASDSSSITVTAPEYSGYIYAQWGTGDSAVTTPNNDNVDTIGYNIENGYVANTPDAGKSIANAAGKNFWTDDRYLSVWNSGTTFTNSRNPIMGTIERLSNKAYKYEATNKKGPFDDGTLYGYWGGEDNMMWDAVLGGSRTHTSTPDQSDGAFKSPPSQVDTCVINDIPFITFLDDGWEGASTFGRGLSIRRDGEKPTDSIFIEPISTDRYRNQFQNVRIAGSYTSSKYHVYVVYYDAYTKCLKYAKTLYKNNFDQNGSVETKYHTGTSSSGKYVIAGKDTLNEGTESGQYCDIKVTNTAVPIVIYYYKSNGDNGSLAIAKANGSDPSATNFTWDITSLENPSSNIDFGRYVSMEMDSSENLHITAQDVTNGVLYYGCFKADGTKIVDWMKVDATDSVGRWTDIKLEDSENTGLAAKPVITYMSTSKLGTKFAVKVAYLDNSNSFEAITDPSNFEASDQKLSLVLKGRQIDSGNTTIAPIAVGINSTEFAVDFLRDEQ
ncbi:MAG: Ig-like domain-containing protein [Treponema sp.]|nr:Ig-like domain-containing protein [Treponema sp.]